MKGGAPAPAQPSKSPTVAARVPVFKASEMPPAGATVVLKGSPVAAVVAKPQAVYSLVVVRPDGSHGESKPLEKQVTVLGRVEGDIVFPDDTLISRKHARFTVADDSVYVEDMNSANGVFWRLRNPHTLKDGDIVLMGRQMFRFTAPVKKDEKPPEKGKDAKKDDKAAPAATAELVRLLPGGVEEQRFPLQAGENILGRTRGTITFPQDAYLSSQHARIRFEGGKFIVADMNAANGTFIGVREKTKLSESDIVLLGHQLLRISKG